MIRFVVDFLIGAALCAGLAWPPAASAAPGRGVTVDDLFRSESVARFGAAAMSDDGAVAIVRTRPLDRSAPVSWRFDGNERSDVWIQQPGNRALRNITEGATDNSGWWSPVWSPDGRHLAMLSTRGGGLRIWVWERYTGRLFVVDDRTPNLQTPGRPFEWRNARSIAFAALQAGTDVRRMRTRLSTPILARQGWDRAAADQPSASLLSSGASPDGPESMAERDELRLIDIRAPGAGRTVLTDSIWNVAMAPITGNVAFARRVRLAPDSTTTLRDVAFQGRWQLGIARPDGTPFRSLGALTIEPRSLRWNPLGNELAFIGRAARAEPFALMRFSATSGRFVRCALDGLDLGPEGSEIGVHWADGDTLLVRYRSTGASSSSAEWRIVGSDCAAAPLAGADAVAELLPEPDRAHFVGLRNGRLVRFGLDGAVTTLAEHMGPIGRIVMQAGPKDPRSGQARFLVEQSSADSRGEFVLVTPATREIATFRAIRGEPIALDPNRRMLIAQSNDHQGFRLAQHWVDGRSHILAEGNSFRREISPPRMITVRYRADDDSPANAELLLPENYRAGHRYPLIAWLYGGQIVTADAALEMAEDFGSWLNPRVATNLGFAVLIPSIPLGPEGVADEPCERIRRTTEASVEAAVDSGVADAARLYLFGHSYGGYSVYCSIAGSTRFRAAVATAAVANLTSNYGQFSGDERFGADPQRSMYFPRWAELGQGRMGRPPWLDLDRYLRNSPIHRAGCIRTPILIVHGDLDFVPIQQAEEMFTALYRQGKRADFIRYWGEDHNLSQPANIRDYWRRVFEWFGEDRHPPPPEPRGSC